jgi:hypothetical protein
MRNDQVAQMHGRFEVDGHFFHVKCVRDFDLHERRNEREGVWLKEKKKMRGDTG